MSKQYAFYINSSACSGCKTCQVACKDKHDLDVGILWRRVYEVSGGDWIQDGDAWTPNVFAYYVSISCNQCEEPICVSSCPTKALACGTGASPLSVADRAEPDSKINKHKINRVLFRISTLISRLKFHEMVIYRHTNFTLHSPHN